MIFKLTEQHIHDSKFKRFIRNYRIGLFLIFIVTLIIANRWRNNINKEEHKFLKSLHLELTLKVLDVKPTDNHSYGVVYGQVIKSNKPSLYNAVCHDKYVFCKTKDDKVLFVSDYYVMQKNDSVVVNGSIGKYWVYRKGPAPSEYNLTNTTDCFLYSDLEKNKYLEFSTYRK